MCETLDLRQKKKIDHKKEGLHSNTEESSRNPFNIVTENTPKAFLEIVHRPKTLMKVPDVYENLNLKDIKKNCSNVGNSN